MQIFPAIDLKDKQEAVSYKQLSANATRHDLE